MHLSLSAPKPILGSTWLEVKSSSRKHLNLTAPRSHLVVFGEGDVYLLGAVGAARLSPDPIRKIGVS